MGNSFDFLNLARSPVEIRQIFQRILTKLARELGSMASQDADDVDITGGSIEGADIDVTGQTLTLDNKQIDVTKLKTTEMDTTLVLTPDGAGGVKWSFNISLLAVKNGDGNYVKNADGNRIYA